MTSVTYAIVGIVVGGLHATMLSRAVRSRHTAGSLVVRLAIVAAVLLVAARARHLVATACGWAVGFAAVAAATHRGAR